MYSNASKMGQIFKMGFSVKHFFVLKYGALLSQPSCAPSLAQEPRTRAARSRGRRARGTSGRRPARNAAQGGLSTPCFRSSQSRPASETRKYSGLLEPWLCGDEFLSTAAPSTPHASPTPVKRCQHQLHWPRLAPLGVVRHDVAIDELPKPMVCLAVFELLGTLSSLLVDG